ncbi:MAG: ATP synthase F0 subunit C [Desulfobacterales bacterium]|nr:ATP synthase F0 subunit C [Desulfobacterales bacterium]
MDFTIKNLTEAAAFVGAGIAIGFGAIGAAIGEGYTAACANEAISRNSKSTGDIFKTMLVGQAVAESASIFALVIALILLFTDFGGEYTLKIFILLSAGISMGFGAIGSGIGSGFPAGSACLGISRQPSASSNLMTNMLIGSAVCQTPAIFSLVIAFVLLFTDFSSLPLFPCWGAILGAGISTGLAAMGPGIGGGLAAGASCEGVARKPSTAGNTTRTMLLGQAVSQTTAIYGLLISFILLFKVFPPSDNISSSFALLSAGICMGLGAIGPGVGEGATAGEAVRWVARNEGEMANLIKTMLVGQAVAESTGIYSLVIALILIFVI